MANILVIDDDKNLCTTLAEFIHSLGYFVTYALRLKEGLDKARSGLFDIVFLDIRLPDGNGLKAVPHFQKNSLFFRQPCMGFHFRLFVILN